MTPVYAAKLGLKPWLTNVSIQKIDSLAFEIHAITSARLSL